MLSRFRYFTIKQRLAGLIVLTLVIVAALVFKMAVDFREGLYEGRSERTQNLVETGMGMVERYYERYQSGELSESEAREMAAEALRPLRYGDDDYFWIHDMDFEMIMHPFSTDLEGESVRNTQDPEDTYLFREMNRVVREEGGGGFVPYMWPKPGMDDPVEKISYVERFEPWDWVIGTGIYIDDMEADFAAYMGQLIVFAVLGVGILAGVSALILYSVTIPLERAAQAMTDIASGEGDLTQRLDAEGRDEVAKLAGGFNGFVGIIANVVRELRDLVHSNEDIATRVRDSINEAGQSFDQQKSELDTVSSAIEEMTQTIDDVAKRINEAADAARDADGKAQEGEGTANRTRQQMESLAEQISESSQAISQLDEHAQNIGQVLDVIHGVADQTNLLALNAAIEAARAGEHGRGFAVVADEVRSLASRTQQSTDEIREMINSLQEGTAKAVTTMQHSSEQSRNMQEQVESARATLQEIAGSVNTITDMTQHVATSAEEQSQASNEISASLNHLLTLAGQVREELNAIEEQSSAISDSAQSLGSVVRQFRID